MHKILMMYKMSNPFAKSGKNAMEEPDVACVAALKPKPQPRDKWT